MYENIEGQRTGSWYRMKSKDRAAKYRSKMLQDGFKITTMYLKVDVLKQIDELKEQDSKTAINRSKIINKALELYFKHERIQTIKRLKKKGLTSGQIGNLLNLTDRKVRKLW